MPNPRRGLRILVSSPTGVSTGARTSENLVTNANPDGTTERERVQPEVVDPVAASADTAPSPDAAEQVTRPTKLIRIASMVRTMLEEVRLAPLDDAGRRRLREIHERSLAELEEVLSPEAPTESELRLAQAQLVGWLQGLFQGIQATLFTQQTVAQQQLEEMSRRRSLETGSGLPGGGDPTGSGYL